MKWIKITSINQLDEILLNSEKQLVTIFKHSTRCGISKMVLNRFEKAFPVNIRVETYYLDLLNHRDISNEIASRFQVEHQSPQLLLIKEGKVVVHESHYDILEIKIEDYLK